MTDRWDELAENLRQSSASPERTDEIVRAFLSIDPTYIRWKQGDVLNRLNLSDEDLAEVAARFGRTVSELKIKMHMAATHPDPSIWPRP